jgi:hypothetical protein
MVLDPKSYISTVPDTARKLISILIVTVEREANSGYRFVVRERLEVFRKFGTPQRAVSVN